MFFKTENRTITWSLGFVRERGAHTGPLSGGRGFLYRSGDRPREGFRYRYGDEGLLFSQGFTQVGSQGLLVGLDFAVVEFVVAAELVVVARGLVVVVTRLSLIHI